MKLKKILSLICIVAILLTIAVPSNAASVLGDGKAYLVCDANDDGKVDIRDLVSLKKYSAGVNKKIALEAVDADADGQINSRDLSAIRRFLLGDYGTVVNNDNYWSDEYAFSKSEETLVSKTPPTEKSVTVLTNNYDDKGFSYTTTYDSGYSSIQSDKVTNAKTTVSYNGSTINNITFNDAVIEQSSDSHGYAAHFGRSNNGEENNSAVNNTLKLYKNDGNTLSLFIPEPNTTYTITFDYKAGVVSNDSNLYYGWPSVIKLVYANDAAGNDWSFNKSNVILNRMAYCDAVVDWTTKTLTFRTNDIVRPLGIMIQSLGPWYSSKQNLWIDNVVLKETTQDLEVDFSSKVTQNIVNEDFSSINVGGIPEGWTVNHAYTFLWAADKSQAYLYNGVNVQNDGSVNSLYYFNINGGHILTLPEVNVRNYKYTVKMRINKDGNYRMAGNIGIATDICEDVKQEENANIFYINTRTGDSDIFNREWYVQDYCGIDVQKKTYNVSRDSLLPLQNDRTEVIELTAYHVDGYTYFYFDNNYVGSIKGKDSSTGNKIGIYNYGQWQGVKPEILSVKIDELLDLSDSFDYSEKVFAEDFSTTELGQMPSGMTVLENEQWGWIGNNPVITTKVENDTNKKALRFNTYNRQAAITLPSFAKGDYCMTVNFKIADADNYGSFGLLTNVNGLQGANLLTASMPVGSSNGVGELMLKTRDTWHHYNETLLSVPEVLGKSINSGDQVNMTVYHIGSTSKFYVNDTFVGAIDDYFNTTENVVGIYSCNGDVLVSDIGIYRISSKKETAAINLDSAAIRFADVFGEPTLGGIRFSGTLDKTSSIYTNNISGDYTYSSSAPLEFGLLIVEDDILNGNKLNCCTNGVTDIVVDSDFEQTQTQLTFKESLVNFNINQCDKTYSVRAYIKTNNGTTEEIFYSDIVKVCPSKIANSIYSGSSEEAKTMMNAVYGDSNHFYQSADYNLTFTLFSDLHYLDGCYIARVADLNTIMDRANESNSDFVLQAGDFCNDFRGSPEITNAYLNNAYGLKAYGVYGNHELESSGNNMGYVTTKLTNNSDVVWGTADGKIGDGTIGYYYYKAKGFRVICTDTNYSYNPTSRVWEHNTTNSYGAPAGNTNVNSLGPVQLEWLENVLTDAANNGIPCIVVGHASFDVDYKYGSSSDAAAVMNIFDKVNAIHDKTVILSINGHTHADGPTAVKNGVVYFSMNTALNGYFGENTGKYNSSHTYIKDTYDSDGNLLSSVESPMTALDNNYLNASNFFASPLSTTIRINNLSQIVIEDCDTSWLYDIAPSNLKEHYRPKVTGGTYNLD